MKRLKYTFIASMLGASVQLHAMESNSLDVIRKNNGEDTAFSVPEFKSPPDLKHLCCSAFLKSEPTKIVTALKKTTLPDELQSYVASHAVATLDPNLLTTIVDGFPNHLYPSIGLWTVCNTDLIDTTDECGEIKKLPRITNGQKKALLKTLLAKAPQEQKDPLSLLKFLKTSLGPIDFMAHPPTGLILHAIFKEAQYCTANPSHNFCKYTNFLFKHGINLTEYRGCLMGDFIEQFYEIPLNESVFAVIKKFHDKNCLETTFSNIPEFQQLGNEDLKDTYIAYSLLHKIVLNSLDKVIALGMQPAPEGFVAGYWAKHSFPKKMNAFRYTFNYLKYWTRPFGQNIEYAHCMIDWGSAEQKDQNLFYLKKIQDYYYDENHSKDEFGLKNIIDEIDAPSYFRYMPKFQIIRDFNTKFYRAVLEKIKPFYPQEFEKACRRFDLKSAHDEGEPKEKETDL